MTDSRTVPMFIRCVLALMIAIICSASAQAIEVFAAVDSSGTPIPGGVLNVNYATPTDIWVFASFSQSEAQTVTANGGINSASYLMTIPDFSTVATAITDTDAVTGGIFAYSGWLSNPNSTQVDGTEYYTRAGSAGANFPVADPGVGNYTLVPIARVTITSVAATASTSVSVDQDAINGNNWFTGNFNQFEDVGLTFTPTSFTLNVVPEPSTYALAAVGVMVLGYAGRRKRNPCTPLRAESSL